MNIYDFDGTLYAGDSTRDFLRFSMKKHPSLMRFLPFQGISFALYVLKLIDKTTTKERIYRVFTGYDAESLLEEFWDAHQRKIVSWYSQQQEATDIVISASPEFLLAPICSRLGIRYLIASRVDVHTGKYIGKNCQGMEKVIRLEKDLGITHCDRFFSDSLSDLPLAAIANKAFLVKRGTMYSWE